MRAGVGGLLLCAALTGQIVAAQDHPLLDERGWYLMRDRVGLAPARATALCNNPTSTVDAARERAALAATAAEHSPQVAAVWRELTCARLALWAADARATESYLMPLGTSWDVGAYRALERWLAVSPEDSMALNLLAAVIVDLGHRPKEVGRDGGRAESGASPSGQPLNVPALALLGAVRRGATAPQLMRQCASLLVTVEAWEEARYCALRGKLTHTDDDVWYTLRLAYVAAHRGYAPAALDWFERARATASVPADRAEVLWHLHERFPGNIPEGAIPERRQISIDGRIEALEMPQQQWLEWTRDRMRLVAREGPELPVAEAVPRQLTRISYAGGTFRNCIAYLALGEGESWTCPHQQYGVTLGARHDPFAFALRRGWHPAQGPVLVLTLAAGRHAQPVTLDLVQWNLDRDSGARVTDTFTLAAGNPAGAVRSYPTWSGLLTLSGLLAGQDTLTPFGVERLLPLGDDSLALSDLFIAPHDSPWSWAVETDTLLAWPDLPIDRSRAIEVAAQLRSQVSDDRATLAVELYADDAESARKGPLLQVASTEPVRTGLAVHRRRLDVSRLDDGKYLIGLRLELADGRRVARYGWITLR